MRSAQHFSVTLPVEMAVESWLRKDIAPIYDALQAEPARARLKQRSQRLPPSTAATSSPRATPFPPRQKLRCNCYCCTATLRAKLRLRSPSDTMVRLSNTKKPEHFAQRRTPRDDIRPGPRTIPFKLRVTIAYAVTDARVTVLAI